MDPQPNDLLRLVADMADLAELDLTPAEAEHLAHDLGQMLRFFAPLDAIPLPADDPHGAATAPTTDLRPDLPEPPLDPEHALANAPNQRQGFFTFPTP